ncbi:sialate O-acetylesterase [Dyadobacter alkalitolerans]|uniref:sialate O-acetylesterase n=1 Tax=Dyadobacter alkalitolerans TaxID=492736 RepID=UPI00042217BD|nr:sialate O-acetylesterase [Dyadobacter alkalitolerans]
MQVYIKFILVVLVIFWQGGLYAQTNIRAPKQGGVYQRGADNNAAVPIAGQILGATLPNYTVTCTATRVDGNNNPIAGVNPIQINLNAPKGIFNGTMTLPKGWYRFTFTQGGSTGATNYAGVGDVFVIAGQSNAQGATGAGFTTPAPQGNPELIRGLNLSFNCEKRFPSNNAAIYALTNFDKVGPTGPTRWAYEALGRKISDANADSKGGMPVMFFNTAAGGSSVKNWSDGANGATAYHPNFGTEWCAGFPAGENMTAQPAAYYTGQPYLTLKNVLNWYVQQYGVRAILWHQGEADAANNTSQNSPNATDYSSRLNNVIAKSRLDLNNGNLSWMVARVSLSANNTSGGTPTPNTAAIGVRTGQGNTAGGATNKVFLGPLTDIYQNSSTISHRADNTHFSESNSNGLTVLATLWNGVLDNSASTITAFTRIAPASVPSASASNNNSVYTLSTVAGYDSYCWVKGHPDEIHNAPPLNSTACFSTAQTMQTNTSGYYRCYVKKGNNWQVTTAVVPQGICSNCREGLAFDAVAKEVTDEETSVGFNVFPNPVESELKVEFNVLRESDVRLEIFDESGNSVMVLANGPHGKGHFTYPLKKSLPKNGAYICQLMIGDLYFTRKIVQIK